jgi:L-ribulose-5-phosphate 3-epimerase
MINLGLRAHDFMINDDIEQLASLIERSKIHYIQFANGISLPELTQHGQKISAGLGMQVKRVLAQHDIQIGVLSSYFNLIHPDEAIQKQGMEQFKQYLTLATNYGVRLVATEPGSLDPSFQPTPDNYERKVVEKTIRNIAELVVTAEKVGSTVGIEAGINHPIHDLDTIEELIDEVDSPALKIILDPVNLLNQDNKADIYEILEEGLKRFGSKIYALHVKDYIFDEEKKIVKPGNGKMDFERFFKIVNHYQPGALVLLDEAPREGLEESLSYLQKIVAKVGEAK